jgi:transcription antitermination factor NusG
MISETLYQCCWFALQTRSRHEKVVRDRLASDGFEYLLPVIQRLSQWSDRKKWIEAPLFAGYCFARFSLRDTLAVLKAPGVVKIVGSSSNLPEPIPEQEIDAIKKLAESELTCDAHPYLVEGTPVQVIKGPLTGVTGHLVRKAGQHHIVIRIRLIQQAASIHISAADVVPIERPPRDSSYGYRPTD